MWAGGMGSGLWLYIAPWVVQNGQHTSRKPSVYKAFAPATMAGHTPKDGLDKPSLQLPARALFEPITARKPVRVVAYGLLILRNSSRRSLSRRASAWRL